MGMYALIEDDRAKALEAANCWHESEEARELIAKAEAFGTLSDRWSGECRDVAKAFSDAASDVEDELDDLRRNAVEACAATYSNERNSDEWLEAWSAADEDAPSVSEILASARRSHAGDSYLERFAA